ncbi:MAG: hypothetical protein MI784_15505, partial [Cytophagales bacterium]|nr:hypothetical protein [Cytophagales bacterium]
MKRIAPLFFAFLYFQSLLSLAEVKKLSTAEAVAGLSATRNFEFDNWEEPVIHEEAFLEDSFYAEAWVDKDLKIPKKHIKTVKKINGFFNKVKNDGRLVKFLQPEMAFDLPVGIERKVGGVSFIILIEEMKILPNSAVITASAVIEFSGRKLYFRGTDIPFSNSGGIAGTAKLALLTDQEVAVGNNQKFVFKGSRGETYLTWDCNGFKEMSLDLDLVFSRSLVIPEDANGNPDRSRQLTANLKTKIESWDDFVLSVNLPAFRLAKSPDMRFALRQAVLDMSDTKSAAGVKLPVGYLSTYYGDMGEELWKGVYIKEILVTLPRAFKKSGKPIELGANNFILDEKGVSGEFFARDVMDLDKGKLGKWRYSIEDIAVNLECSQFTEFCINGELQIPLTKEDQLFGYHAYLNAEDVYQFSVSNRKDLSFPLWGAGKVKLEPNSSVEVMIIKDDFYPAATLSGEMDINPGKVSLANIEFQELKIQTQEKPYVRAERFGVGSEKLKNMMRGFPVQVSDIELVANSEDKEEIGMHITLSVELMKASKGGFGAEGELTVWGREKPEDVISYKYSRLQFHAFEVDFRKSGTFEFFGRIEFFENDPTYGDGFQGTIKAKFIGSLELQAMALFGKHKGRSYWFVDVLAIMNQGIPIGSSGLEFVGFGGGAYYGLKQSSFAPQSKLGTKGRSQTGMVYVPDRKAGLGFKATVVISLAKNREAFTGDATFEMSFNRSGGLRQVSFYGKANIMAKSINDLNEKAFNKSMAKMAEGERMDDKKSEGIATDHSAPIFASFMMKYDANERIFDATFNVSINASAIKGNGEARLYFAPDKWFVYVGKPDAPVKLEVLGMFTSESYFMVGDEIPEPPAPPRKLMEILQEEQEVHQRDDKRLAEGKGFAFGVRAEFDSKKKRFLIFYGEFAFGMGFDLMIKKYGDDVLCNGNSD